eukprot:19210-Pyramimonas_sp.AAC.1
MKSAGVRPRAPPGGPATANEEIVDFRAMLGIGDWVARESRPDLAARRRCPWVSRACPGPRWAR